MFDEAPLLRRPITDHLVLKSVASAEDVERVAAFNAAIHGPAVGPMSRELMLHHPHARPDYWLFVDDEATGAIVSALCLLPWTWHVDGVTLRAGEMGIVGTHPDYRRRGLVRALDLRFKELLDEGQFDLSHIQGIPYYYRQFGYEYALPLEGGWEIEPRQIPDAPPPEPRYTFRPATPDDAPVLMELYAAAMQALDIHAVRDAATWRYLLLHNPLTETAREFTLVLDGDDHAGYWAVERYGFGHGLNVCEASHLPHAAALAALVRLKTVAAERGKPFIRLAMADACPLVAAARAWGAHGGERYAWQIHVPDPVRLLRTLAHAFERRIAASPLAGLTQTVVISLYRVAVALEFERGSLVRVDVANSGAEADLRLPPNLLAPLALGWRTREELHRAYPDVSIWSQTQVLVDTLFPTLSAFLYTIY